MTPMLYPNKKEDSAADRMAKTRVPVRGISGGRKWFDEGEDHYGLGCWLSLCELRDSLDEWEG